MTPGATQSAPMQLSRPGATAGLSQAANSAATRIPATRVQAFIIAAREMLGGPGGSDLPPAGGADVEVDLGAPEEGGVDLVLRGVGDVGRDLVGERRAAGAAVAAGGGGAADQLLEGVVGREVDAVGRRPLAAQLGAQPDEAARLV